MRFSRLAVLIWFVGLLTVPVGIIGGAPHTTPELVIGSGDVDQTTAVLWARSPNPGDITFEILAEGTGDILGKYPSHLVDPLLPVKVEVNGLQPGTRYFYRVTDGSGQARMGTFQTPAASGIRAGLRFGVSGDWRGDLAPYPAVSNVSLRNLALFVLLGDTIYADYASPDLPRRQANTLTEFRIKHAEPLSRRFDLNFWGDVRASTAMLAMIDDHEISNDFSGGASPQTDVRFGRQGSFINETPLYRNALQAFVEWMPIRAETFSGTADPRTEGKPKLYRHRVYGDDGAFFLLDARSFRDKSIAPFDPADLFNPLRVGMAKNAAFAPGRTMLGAAQVALLETDLLSAHEAGITWKFILIPQPAQNFGVLAAGDRFEGYAAERAALLDFITRKDIKNVVFITADFHGTFVNNLNYQLCAVCPSMPTSVWEIVTGSVAFDAPTGDSFAFMLEQLGIMPANLRRMYTSLAPAFKDVLLTSMMNALLRLYGDDPLGFDPADGRITLLKGGYVAAHTYGWTEFEIDALSQTLTVTTYGIAPYTADDLDHNPDRVIHRTPEVISQFQVQAQF